MAKKKLYITDLDGTLLDDNAVLSDFALENLTRIIDYGVDFTVATARGVNSARILLRDLPIKLPIIEINGALISDLHTGYHHTINTIAPDIAGDIFSSITSYGLAAFVSSFDGQGDNLYYEKIVNGGMQWFINDNTEGHKGRLQQIDDITAVFSEQIVCMTVIGQIETMKALAGEISSKFEDNLENHLFPNPYSQQWYWLTIHDRRANKAIAVEGLAGRLGYSMEEVVVFGDQQNDIEMMQLNRKGAYTVAVENAIDEVKKYASQTAGSNENDGVVRYILRDIQ